MARVLAAMRARWTAVVVCALGVLGNAPSAHAQPLTAGMLHVSTVGSGYVEVSLAHAVPTSDITFAMHGSQTLRAMLLRLDYPGASEQPDIWASGWGPSDSQPTLHGFPSMDQTVFGNTNPLPAGNYRLSLLSPPGQPLAIDLGFKGMAGEVTTTTDHPLAWIARTLPTWWADSNTIVTGGIFPVSVPAFSFTHLHWKVPDGQAARMETCWYGSTPTAAPVQAYGPGCRLQSSPSDPCAQQYYAVSRPPYHACADFAPEGDIGGSWVTLRQEGLGMNLSAYPGPPGVRFDEVDIPLYPDAPPATTAPASGSHAPPTSPPSGLLPSSPWAAVASNHAPVSRGRTLIALACGASVRCDGIAQFAPGGRPVAFRLPARSRRSVAVPVTDSVNQRLVHHASALSTLKLSGSSGGVRRILRATIRLTRRAGA